MAATNDKPKDDTKRDKDRRQHESWLHDALELSLFERFNRRNGLTESDTEEAALILHGPRSGSHPDFALLNAERNLILVELKRGPLTRKKAEDVVKQMRKYVADYASRRLGELATWYCHHGVDVNTTFGYRGEDYIVRSTEKKHAGYDYGRLNRWSLKNLPAYQDGCKNAQTALDALRQDYKEHVGGSLELGVEDRLAVVRCILIAEAWVEDFEPKPIEGASIELWRYTAPAQWARPLNPARRAEAAS